MKIIISLQKPIGNYSFGYSIYESQDTATWYDSNIINITDSGNYFIFIKNKTTGLIEKVQRVYVNCLNGNVVCNITYTVVKNLSLCEISYINTKALSTNNVLCKISFTPIISISVCNINYVPSKKLN